MGEGASIDFDSIGDEVYIPLSQLPAIVRNLNSRLAALEHEHSAGDITSGILSADRIADGSLLGLKLAPGTVTLDLLGEDVNDSLSQEIDGSRLVAKSVSAAKLADKSVLTEKLADKSVTKGKIAESVAASGSNYLKMLGVGFCWGEVAVPTSGTVTVKFPIAFANIGGAIAATTGYAHFVQLRKLSNTSAEFGATNYQATFIDDYLRWFAWGTVA